MPLTEDFNKLNPDVIIDTSSKEIANNLYQFPKLSGFRGNIIQKISLELNIPESKIYISDDIKNTYVGFNVNNITEQQKTLLNNIMQNNPSSIPVDKNKPIYKIKDIWKMRNWLAEQIGVPFKVWFDEEKPDGYSECNIYIQFDRPLTLIEKTKIINVYRNLISELGV